MTDSLGDRMKAYESAEAQRRLDPASPVVIRLDGRSFSTWTRGLRRPFDERLSSLMGDLTVELVRETNARLGYTQSDEITLVLHVNPEESQLYFDGRAQKIASCLAGYAAAWFNREVPARIPERASRLATFDCRVFNVPSLVEAANCVLWREQDAIKNSITMAAMEHYSHRELHGIDGRGKLNMLRSCGVEWSQLPTFFTRGTYVMRVSRRGRFTTDEIEALPPKHAARSNPDLEVERSVIQRVAMGPLADVTDRVAALFPGAASCPAEHAPSATRAKEE